MSSFKPRFLKPRTDDVSWREDKSDADPTGHTSFIYNPYVSLTLEQQRQKLPVFRCRNEIIYLLEKYQTLVLVGETGCGKSTQVPQYLIEAGWTKDGKVVGVTQPRRVAATTLATRVAEERGCNLGREVGYSIRFDDCYDPETTKIKYMTEGILIREMMADPLLQHYCVLMLDEVHERTLNTDILLGLLKKILKKRRDLRVIVSSATLDADEMKDFFNINKNDRKDTATIMSIHGRAYPVDVYYLNEPVADYVKASVDTVMKIHTTEAHGDILVFLTGQEEVNTAVSLLREYANKEETKTKDKLWPLPMYGSLPPGEQLKVFRRTLKGTRKVVVATNIAETSITIYGITYVVDSGFHKLRWFNPDTRMDALVIIPVSQASAEQRAGRAGRTHSGKVYRLYPESEFDKLQLRTAPEMQRTDLSTSILQLKALGIDNIVRFNFPSPPPASNLAGGLELLYALGALDSDGNLTDPVGLQLAEFPLHPTMSKMLLKSGEFGCSEEIVTIVAMLQIESIFLHAANQSAKSRVAKRKFEVEEGDLITLLNVYNAFITAGRVKQWCAQNMLNYKGLLRAEEMRKRMIKMLKRFGVPIKSADGNVECVRRCITAGLFSNAAYLHHSGQYHSVRGEQILHVHPNSVLYTLEPAHWVLFVEVLHTHKLYMRDLTVVDPAWLEELAPHFYQRTIVRNY